MLTLAFGIGATTAMFSVIDNVLLGPFPYADQQRLVSIVIRDPTNREGGSMMLHANQLLAYREGSDFFSGVMGVAINRALWRTGTTPQSVNAPIITANAFQFLGAPALLGRIATPADLRSGAAPICVMGYSFWQSRFAGSRSVLGKKLILDGVPTTVIVMPPRFVFWSGDVWLPSKLRHGEDDPAAPWFSLLGRLKPGVTMEAADPGVQVVTEQIARCYPQLYPKKFAASLQTFADASIGKFRRTLFTLLGAVGLLLLIACANVANLLLARAVARGNEFAIRSSLGAGWWRVARQLFTESAVLAFLGASAGWVLAWGGLKVLVAVLPADTFPDEAVIGLNWHVFLATSAVEIGTAIFFGLVPVLGGLRRDVNETLKSGGRQHSDFRQGWMRNGLIVCEVAISLVLLAAAGLLMRSFLRERAVELGLNPRHLLTAEVFTAKNRMSVARQIRFEHDLTNSIRRLPGLLDMASTTDFVPFDSVPTDVNVAGKIHAERWTGRVSMIDPKLFTTLGVRLMRGRGFSQAEVAERREVAIVNQAFVSKYLRGGDPIGQHVQVTVLTRLPVPVSDPWFEIAGVTSDFRNNGLQAPVAPEVYIPYTLTGFGGFVVIVRTAGDADGLARQVEGAALTLDSSAVVRHIRTMQEGLESGAYAKPRFGLRIFAVFALLGVLLVSVGLYSIMSYTVSQRKRELGIRLALGATAREMHVLVIKSGMRYVGVGIAAGLLLCFALLRYLQSQVWGVSTHDPLTMAWVIGILVAVGVAACYLPSRAVTRVDPALTLRSE